VSKNERDFSWSVREKSRASRSERNSEQPMLFIHFTNYSQYNMPQSTDHLILFTWLYLLQTCFIFTKYLASRHGNFTSVNYRCERWGNFTYYFPCSWLGLCSL